MGDLKRGDDAADHAPQPKHEERAPPPGSGGEKQDAPNYKTTDDGQALDDKDVNSANDE